MKVKLTLQEKLRDLRDERKLQLVDVSEGTGIPTTTLQRFESDEDARVGYQDIEVLTRFYGVSADYLFGLTDHREYRNVEVDKLGLSDEAIGELVSGKLNNRLLGEIIVHPGFCELLAALEVFLDRNIGENMRLMNMTYKVATDAINKKSGTVGRDEYLATLKEADIDPVDYLRFRLCQRFDGMAKDLYDKQERETPAGEGYLESFIDQIRMFEEVKDKTGSAEQAKLALLADQLGVNMKKASDAEKQALLNLLGRSKHAKFFKKRK